MQSQSPYERGYDAGYALKPGPAFVKPDTRWEDRLYARGWSRGVDVRRARDAAVQAGYSRCEKCLDRDLERRRCEACAGIGFVKQEKPAGADGEN